MASYYSPTTRQALNLEPAFEDYELPPALAVQSQPKKEETVVDKLAQQILSQGTTSQWSGEGFGSAEANARDMAKILADQGFTNINQFGAKTVEVPEQVEYIEGENGPMYGYTIPATTKTVFYNKDTGQEIDPGYSRAGGNVWSGTFSGKGSTHYAVDFDEQGNPYFYTEYGGTTSDAPAVRDAIKFLAGTVGMATPMAPFITAANAVNAASKGDWKNAILSAAMSAAPIAKTFGVTGDTLSSLKEVADYAKVAKAAASGDIVGAGLRAAGIAGVEDIGGVSIADATKALNVARAIESGNPLALVGALSNTTQKTPTKMGFDVGDAQPEEGYFAPGGPGWDNVDWSGYANLTPEQLAALDMPEAQITPTPIEIPEIVAGPEADFQWETVAQRQQELPDFVYDMPEAQITPTPIEIPEIVSEDAYPEMVVTAPRTERPELDLSVPSEDFQVQPTPIEIPDIVGPTPTTAPKPTPSPTPAPTPSPAPSAAPFDLSGLLALLGGQQQAAPYMLSVPENAADIKLMEDIFGTSLSAPSTGNETDKATALARLLRS